MLVSRLSWASLPSSERAQQKIGTKSCAAPAEVFIWRLGARLMRRRQAPINSKSSGDPFMKKQGFVIFPLLLGLAGSTSLAWGHDSEQNQGREQFRASATLEGVWRVSRHGVSCATGEQLSPFR